MIKNTYIKPTNLIAKFYFALFTLLLFISIPYSSLLGGNKIKAAGASFPFPIYSKMFAQYNRETGVEVNYQSIGSGGGIRQIRAETVDFGATDEFIKDEYLDKIFREKGRKLLHIPTVLGGVVITYNFLQKKIKLNLDGRTIADIFMGKISKWNDPKIKNLNQGINLPNKKIVIVRRSDGSGTTSTFTEFLAHYSEEWKSKYGIGKSINWYRRSIGSKGNEGVTGQIKNIPFSIGYISLNYALAAKLQVAAVKNAKGKFVLPSVESVTVAANTHIPKDTRINLASLDGSIDSYPISTFTWIVFYQEQNYNGKNLIDGRNLQDLLNWMISKNSQKLAVSLHFSPLPPKAVEYAKAIISSMTYNSKKI